MKRFFDWFLVEREVTWLDKTVAFGAFSLICLPAPCVYLFFHQWMIATLLLVPYAWCIRELQFLLNDK